MIEQTDKNRYIDAFYVIMQTIVDKMANNCGVELAGGEVREDVGALAKPFDLDSKNKFSDLQLHEMLTFMKDFLSTNFDILIKGVVIRENRGHLIYFNFIDIFYRALSKQKNPSSQNLELRDFILDKMSQCDPQKKQPIVEEFYKNSAKDLDAFKQSKSGNSKPGM